MKSQSIWRRIATLLDFHQKLIMENRDKRRMDATAQKIKRLTSLLEYYDKTLNGVDRPHFDGDGEGVQHHD